MAKFNFSELLAGVNDVVATLEKLAPLAVVLGAPAIVANVATMAIAATGALQNVVERVADAKEALSTADEAKLKDMLKRLQGVNDKLAGIVADDTAAAVE